MADLHDPRVTLAAPMSGDAIALEDIPDPVFSSGALGNGYGVNRLFIIEGVGVVCGVRRVVAG